jgi:hypothetical protein
MGYRATRAGGNAASCLRHEDWISLAAAAPSAGGDVLADAVFGAVVLDEGSQCAEPEALIPLSKARAVRDGAGAALVALLGRRQRGGEHGRRPAWEKTSICISRGPEWVGRVTGGKAKGARGLVAAALLCFCPNTEPSATPRPCFAFP